ncbi:MAG: putative rane protein [Cytophagaceae bacterium]|nr:putative rane protein [Cytophagaceae bacterium]
MKNRLYIGCLLFLLCSGGIAVAQNNGMYTQYLFNGLVINPAYAGSHNALSASSVLRKQWLGVDGSPFASTFSVHSPVNKHKSSFGGLLYQSKTSIYNELTLQGVYSYRVEFDEEKKLSLGLGVGFTNYAIRYSNLTHQDPNDPAIPADNQNLFQPTVSAGAYYYTNTFFAGISGQNLTGYLYSKDDTRSYQHLFATTGKVFTVSPKLKLKPGLLLHYYNRSPLLVDLNFHALLDEVIWLGVSYRHQVSVNYSIKFNLNRQLSFGYSYDQSIGNKNITKNGAHEIALTYLFKYYKKNIVNPRFF